MSNGAETPPAAPDALPRGATVGRYVIVDAIARGGMGVVYAAFDSQLDRKVAVKLLRAELAEGDRGVEVQSRLHREAQAMARLNHPNVITVYDVGTCDAGVFLAMEFVEGVTLGEWLRTPHAWRERVAVMCEAGKGLAAAHAAGLVHRDFKPDNVLIRKDGRVIVLDFGLARAVSDTSPEAPLPSVARLKAEELSGRTDTPWSSPLTEVGQVLGTVGYLAPEQGFGEVANAATDQFGFSVALYVALYGERPFPATKLRLYVEQACEPPPEPKGGKDVPLWLRRIVLRGMAPNPEARFPSMDALLVELAKDPTLARRRALSAALVAVAIVTGIGAGVAAVVSGLRQRDLVCAADPAEMKGVWDDATRAAMTQAFEKTGAEGARESAERVAKKFDEFAAHWTEMRADVCRATRVRKQQPEDMFRLRNDCLDRERTEARSISLMLASADAEVVKQSIEIAYGLPQLSWCADVATLRASAGLPDDPAKREKVLEVRAKLADASAAQLVGRVKVARAAATEAVALARSIGHGATTAEALASFGETVQRQGDHVEALPILEEALFVATEAGNDAAVVRVLSALAYTLGPKLQRGEEAKAWLRLGRATLARMGGSERLELDLMRTETFILAEVDWRPELALPVKEKLVEAGRRLFGVSPATANALYTLGVSWSYAGEPARARPYYEEALAMHESIGGSDSEDVARDAYALGQTEATLGEFQKGDAHMRRATDVFQRAGDDYWAAITYQALTWSGLAQGDVTAAVSAADQSLQFLEKAKRPKVLIPIVNAPAGSSFTRAGRAREALSLCDDATAEQERTKAFEPQKTYGWDALRCKSEALIALGRGVEAIPHLERSLSLKKRMFPADYARVEFALARALTAGQRDPARALDLAKAARDDFAKYPFLAFERHEIEAWLAKHGGHE